MQIALSATFDGSKAINDGNVLFLGSRCSAHSMANGTVESSVNAMTRYASVRWYAYGSSDPANNLRDMLTKKGEKVSLSTVTLVGGNHFVHKEMMDDLYAELVEKKNRDDGYDLIILEFDGDLLCRDGYAPYQLNYRLPEGWTDEKAALLRAEMSRYYEEDRVVWIVPDVNQEKSDAGYTGEYPWTSNPEFIWQRAFLNATETEGYRCPLQKNYEDADELVDYLKEVLVGHFFSNAIIEDTLANGLTIKKVTPKDPEVAVTNGVTELIRDVDYTVAYGNNTNATEEAYAVITGIGNYEGSFTNYFTILPREVTLMSGTKTMYLDPAHPGEPVVCSNALVFVVSGSFVTNAATGVKDGFVATDMTVLESATPIGPVDNAFTAVANPGLATNYFFTCVYGKLEILDTPAESHGEIHEEVPTQDGEGVIDVVMDNREAGIYAANKPPELNDLEELVEKTPREDVEVRLLVSTNYLEKSFGEVTNKVVETARSSGKSEKEIKNYSYDALDIAVNETRWLYESVEDAQPTNVVVRDIGNEIDADHMLTIAIPYAFNPKLIEFSVWRNHTNESSGIAHEGVVELTQSAVPIPETETWTTNEASVILRVHKFSVYVFKTLVLTAPQLTGRMRWKYHRAHSVFYGGLDVVCTNGDNRTISNLSYVYENRDDCYLRSLTSRDRLSETSVVTYGGKDFGLVRLDDVAAALREGALNVTSRCGVAETTFTDPSWKDRYVVPTLEERRIALATTSIEKLANGDPSVVDSTLGYLTWQEEGYDTVYWCALAEGLEPLPVDSLSGGTVPLTLAMANKAKAYGLPPLTPDSDSALVLEAFKVEDGVVRGRVAMRDGEARGVPGSNAQLTVLGAAVLTDAFAEVAWPQLSKDGSFSFRPPEEIRYFRVRLTVRDVIR